MAQDPNQPYRPDPDDSEGRGLFPKSLHKALVTGVSAVLMTEEGIRNALGDLRLPKEAINYVIQQTERSRRDLFQAVTGEVKGFLSSADITGSVRKALTGMRVDVRAQIRFIDDTTAQTEIETDFDTASSRTEEATPAAPSAPSAPASPRKKRVKRSPPPKG